MNISADYEKMKKEKKIPMQILQITNEKRNANHK